MYGSDLTFVIVCGVLAFGFLFAVMIAEHIIEKK